MIGLKRGSRGTQQRDGVFEFRADNGDVAAVIPRRLFLLETVFLLLVHDHQAEIFERREHRGARAHHHARQAISNAPPLTRTFHVAQGRVQNSDAFKMRAKPRPALAADPQRQSDLRDKDDRCLPARQRLLHAAQVHLGLSAAGDAVNQLHAEFAQFESRTDGPKGPLLRFIQCMRRRGVADVEWILRGIDRFLPAFQQSIAQHALNQRARNARKLQQLR